MTWIDDNKGEGPWAFEKQSEKPYYNEGNLISNKNDHVWKMDFSGVPITPTHNPCGYWHNNPVAPPPSSCDGAYIGYTTQQMAANESQGLNVENPVDGCSYSWEITSGGGSLSRTHGLHTTYIAPSTNGECLYNPTITLSLGEIECDSLAIAINVYGIYLAYYIKTECILIGAGGTDCMGNVNPHAPHYLHQCCVEGYNCDGSFNMYSYWTLCHSQYSYGCGITWCDENCNVGDIIDTRSSAQIAGGCCPAELL